MGQACSSIHQGGGKTGGDKTYEDCEDWCDEGKIGHCRYCKCRGCKHCHGDLSLPDWVLGGSAQQQCASFGLCGNASLTYPLCLSVWRGEVHEGAPLVWSRCRTDMFKHQQWKRVPSEAGFLLQHAEEKRADGGTERLCVAAPLPTRLLHG